MYRDITEQCRQAINGSSRTFAASFLCDGITYSDIKSLKIPVPSALSGKINIGDTISKSVEIEIASANILLGSTITVYEAVKLISGEYEDIPMGKFKVSKSATKESITTIEAEGPLSTETSLGYFSELVYPATTVQMLNEISSFIGVVIETDGLEEIIVSTKPEGYTCREVIGYVAALHGTNAVETREGTIALKWYENCEEDIFTDKIDSPELENDLFVIEKFECVQGDTSIVKGAGFTGISIENPLMTEEIADLVWNKISGFCYRPGTFPIKLGTPLVDPWDSFTYNGERVIAAELEYIHDGGLQNSYKSIGESRTSSASKGPLAQKMDRYYADLLLVKDLMADALTVKEADIRYLKADSISAITLVVKEAAIAELSADFVTVETVEANYANINLSNVEKSTIGTLFADIGLITDATIKDGHVTGFLDAVEVNANSVTAGTLSVDRLVFRGSNKSIVYELNNITGALQAVQSETLNGEILTNRSVTVDKIVAKSITANEIATATITANEVNILNLSTEMAKVIELDAGRITSGYIGAERIKVSSLETIVAKIGGFDIGDKYFANNATQIGTIENSVYVGTDGISCGTGFVAYENGNCLINGELTAKGTITVTGGIWSGFGPNMIFVQDGISATFAAGFWNHETSAVGGTAGIVTGIKFDTPIYSMSLETNGLNIEGKSIYVDSIHDKIMEDRLETIRFDDYGSIDFLLGIKENGIALSDRYMIKGEIVQISSGGTGATTVADARTNLGLGAAATYGVTTSATSGSTELITSGAVYSGLAGKAASSHTHSYLPLSGGTLTGNLSISANTSETADIIFNRPTNYSYDCHLDILNNGFRMYRYDKSGTYKQVLFIDLGTGALTPGTALSIGSGGTGATTAAGIHQNITGSHFTTPVYIDCMGSSGHSGGGGYCTLAELKTAMALNNVNNTADSAKSVSYATNAGKLLNNSADVYMLVNDSKNFKTYAKSTGKDLNNAVTLGTSNARIKQLFAGTACNISSDRNLKDNIVPLTAIHKQFFMKLIPVSYTFKDGDSGRTHVGFISQDVEQAMSELGMSSLDFAGFCKDVKMTTRMEKVPVYDKDGNMTYIDNEVSIPNLDANGNYQYIYSLRYEEFIALIAYVLQDYIRKAETTDILLQSALSRLSMVEIQIANMAA